MGFGLHADPVGSAIDSFTKVKGALNADKRLAMEEEDRQSQREQRSLTMQREQNTLDEQEADKPVKAAERQKQLEHYENQQLAPEWETAEKELMTAAQENRTPNLTPKQAAAVEVAAQRSAVPLDAIHTLSDTMGQFMPTLESLPAGAKVRIDDAQHPQALEAFNKVYGKQMGGTAKALYYDKDKNTFAVGLAPDKSGWGKREDGSEKGTGFLGVLKRPDGGVSTEISVGVNIGGKETEIPTLVPTLTKDEVNYLLENDEGKKDLFRTETGKGIMQKAVDFARQRIEQGKSPFADDSESPGGGTSPMLSKDGKYAHEIPADRLFKDVVYHGMAAHMIEATRYNADPEYRKKVQTEEQTIKANAKQAHAIDGFKDWKDGLDYDPDVNEQRTELRSRLLKANVPEKDIDSAVSKVIQPKAEAKPRNLTKMEEGAGPGKKRQYMFDQDSGERVQGSEGEPYGDDTEEKERRKDARDERKEDRRDARDARKDARKEKDSEGKQAENDRKEELKSLTNTYNKLTTLLPKAAKDPDLREEYDDLKSQYDAANADYMKKYPDKVKPAGKKTKSRAASLSEAGKTGGEGKKAPLDAVKAAVNTATSKSDAIAILKRQGYTHDENGKPFN